MVAGKSKTVNKLHKELSGKGYRLKHGYALVRCKKSKCGYKVKKVKKE